MVAIATEKGVGLVAMYIINYCVAMCVRHYSWCTLQFAIVISHNN